MGSPQVGGRGSIKGRAAALEERVLHSPRIASAAAEDTEATGTFSGASEAAIGAALQASDRDGNVSDSEGHIGLQRMMELQPPDQDSGGNGGDSAFFADAEGDAKAAQVAEVHLAEVQADAAEAHLLVASHKNPLRLLHARIRALEEEVASHVDQAQAAAQLTVMVASRAREQAEGTQALQVENAELRATIASQAARLKSWRRVGAVGLVLVVCAALQFRGTLRLTSTWN